MRLQDYIRMAENPSGRKPELWAVFAKKRGGKLLTWEQRDAIKTGRKLLRKDMRKRGIKDKEDFELTASSLGLYFDKPRGLLFLRGLFSGRGVWWLLGSLLALMVVLFLYSIMTQMQGHFTINMSSSMFKEGFTLSETAGFENPTTHLFSEAAENVPCISISHIPEDIDQIDGSHNDVYFAYTFYLRNEGQSTVGYDWMLRLNSESNNLASACWVMLFEDGKMMFYAQPNEDGEVEALPPFDDNTRGYLTMPTQQYCKYSGEQFERIAKSDYIDYYRVVPYAFETDTIVTRGSKHGVAPGDVHKYTVVIWLEGDDPDCTDELIGGHIGMDLGFVLDGETIEDGDEGTTNNKWKTFWENLLFWEE